MPKKRVNLYLDADVADRSKVALQAIGASLSEFVGDYLEGNLPMLEEAARSKDPDKVMEEFHTRLPGLLAKQFEDASEFMRTIQEVVSKQSAKSD